MAAFGVPAIALLLFCLPAFAGADRPPAVPPRPESGSVTPSGKFTPALSVAVTNLAAPQTRAEAEAALRQALNVRQTGPDTFSVGRVEFDKLKRTITLPARVNSRSQILEYALVAETGKTHESLLKTDVKPTDLQLAFLLLGSAPAEVGGAFNTAATVPASNAVTIEVSWETNGTSAKHALTELILLKQGNVEQPPRAMAFGPWLYNGSIFDASGFAAQREGSFISVIRDPAALMNNPRDDRDNDGIHFPNAQLLPVEGWPVNLILHLPGGAVTRPSIQYRGYSPVTPLSTNIPVSTNGG